VAALIGGICESSGPVGTGQAVANVRRAIKQMMPTVPEVTGLRMAHPPTPTRLSEYCAYSRTTMEGFRGTGFRYRSQTKTAQQKPPIRSAHRRSTTGPDDRSVALARVVCRIHVSDAPRPYAMHLEDGRLGALMCAVEERPGAVYVVSTMLNDRPSCNLRTRAGSIGMLRDLRWGQRQASHRRPLLGKYRTSLLKRRLSLIRLIARLRGQKLDTTVARYFGADFEVCPNELMGDGIATNRFEWREITLMIAACRKYRPDLLVDVGANIGLYSCILGKAALIPRVVAFEPDRENFKRLKENVERNCLTAMVQARPFAVGVERGTAYLIPGPPENIGLSRIDSSTAGNYSVALVALDDEIKLRNNIIAIKVDVEGFEMEVLQGAQHLLRNNGGYAQIEGHGAKRVSEIRSIMRDFGWQLVDRCGINLLFEKRP
jgi:FkbM family methyltransferase